MVPLAGLFFLYLLKSIKTRFTLGKTERLKSRKLIDQLFKEGKAFSLSPFRIIYIFPGDQKVLLQAGFTVSTKKFKKAVERNRIKRLMRETYRLQKSSLQLKLEATGRVLNVFFVYTATELPEYDNLLHKMSQAISRLEKIADESTPENT